MFIDWLEVSEWVGVTVLYVEVKLFIKMLDCRQLDHLLKPLQKTCQSVYYHLHNIRQIRKFLTPTSTKLLIQGVIMARIDYCNGLLYSVLTVILQRLQNSAARLITHTSSYCHITPVLLALHWGWWSSQFAIKSLWSLSRLFTVWGLRI